MIHHHPTPQFSSKERRQRRGKIKKTEMGKLAEKLKIFFALLLVFFVAVQAVQLSICDVPLGMEDGRILDEDITASSSKYQYHVGPQQARIRNESRSGAWCPNDTVGSELNQWLQIDLRSVHVIIASEIQGRYDQGKGIEFADFYAIEYFRPRLNTWHFYETKTNCSLLTGNHDTMTVEKTSLEHPLLASKVRFYPYNKQKRYACLRVEIYGCHWTDGILSYTMRQGDNNESNMVFYDTTYDGQEVGNMLVGGLGQLFDGYTASDGSLEGWVGWQRDHIRPDQPVEIVFEFEQLRQFQAMHIFTSNQFPISNVSVYFSPDGTAYESNFLFFIVKKTASQPTCNVTKKLCNKQGRFIKLHLHFGAEWLLISEVKFDSFPGTSLQTAIHCNNNTEINCEDRNYDGTSLKLNTFSFLILCVAAPCLIVIVVIITGHLYRKIINQSHLSDIDNRVPSASVVNVVASELEMFCPKNRNSQSKKDDEWEYHDLKYSPNAY